MKTFLKHLLLDFAIVFGNIFLSHGVIWLGNNVVNFLHGIVMNPIKMEHMTILLMCAMQILINILLYKTLLKKFFFHAKKKKLTFYFLHPIIPYMIWIVVFNVSVFAGYTFSIETYIQLLISFMPLILITLIPFTIAYCLCFGKYIGEAYYVYMLSLFGVTVIPITIIVRVILG